MRIALMARGQFGRAVLEAFTQHGFTIAGIVGSGEPGDALEAAAAERGISVLARGADAAAMAILDADLAVIGFGEEAIPPVLLTAPRNGAIQVHASLLPRYRGPTPVPWPIARGEVETGITVIRPRAEPYEGPVILQRTCPIPPEATQADLCGGELRDLGVEGLVTAAQLVTRGEQIEIDQDAAAATYEGPFGDAEAEIHWSSHAEIVHNLIRAANPDPGAWTRIGGERVRILDVCLTATHRASDVKGKPGEIASVDEDGVCVCAPGGIIAIRRVRPEGGEAMPATDFAKARNLAPGHMLGA